MEKDVRFDATNGRSELENQMPEEVVSNSICK